MPVYAVEIEGGGCLLLQASSKETAESRAIAHLSASPLDAASPKEVGSITVTARPAASAEAAAFRSAVGSGGDAEATVVVQGAAAPPPQ